jgi:hypothetical protein
MIPELQQQNRLYHVQIEIKPIQVILTEFFILEIHFHGRESNNVTQDEEKK